MRHVALDTARPGAADLMEVVRRRVIGIGLMTAHAEGVSGRDEFHRMRIVAVGAAHSGMMHLALHEGSEHVGLFFQLAVVMIEPLAQDRGSVGVMIGLSRIPLLVEKGAVRMAGSAGLDLHVRFERPRPFWHFRLRIDRPGEFVRIVPGIFQRHDEPFGNEVILQARERGGGRRISRVRLGFRFRSGPLHVLRSRTVTGLAAHVHLRPGRVVGERARVEALVEIRRVAVGAHVVPIEVTPRPVKDVVGRHRLVGIQVIPALSALFLRPRIPADLQRLIPAAREGNEVLLQGVVTEGVFDLHVARRAGLVEGIHPVSAVLPEKAEDLPEVIEGRVVEITEDEFLRRRIHRLVVIAQEPILKLGLVAGLAALVTDVGRAGDVVVGRRRCGGRRLIRPFLPLARREEANGQRGKGEWMKDSFHEWGAS